MKQLYRRAQASATQTLTLPLESIRRSLLASQGVYAVYVSRPSSADHSRLITSHAASAHAFRRLDAREAVCILRCSYVLMLARGAGS